MTLTSAFQELLVTLHTPIFLSIQCHLYRYNLGVNVLLTHTIKWVGIGGLVPMQLLLYPIKDVAPAYNVLLVEQAATRVPKDQSIKLTGLKPLHVVQYLKQALVFRVYYWINTDLPVGHYLKMHLAILTR